MKAKNPTINETNDKSCTSLKARRSVSHVATNIALKVATIIRRWHQNNDIKPFDQAAHASTAYILRIKNVRVKANIRALSARKNTIPPYILKKSTKKKEPNGVVVTLTHFENPTVLIATAVIKCYDINGVAVIMRMALMAIDLGGQASIITENAAQILRLNRKPLHMPITAVGDVMAGTAHQYVNISVQISSKTRKIPSKFTCHEKNRYKITKENAD